MWILWILFIIIKNVMLNDFSNPTLWHLAPSLWVFTDYIHIFKGVRNMFLKCPICSMFLSNVTLSGKYCIC